MDFMEQSPSKISESSFDDFKKVKPGDSEYDYDPSDYDEGEDDYLYPDRHAPPQSVVPVSLTPAPSMKATPIRLWKVWSTALHLENSRFTTIVIVSCPQRANISKLLKC